VLAQEAPDILNINVAQCLGQQRTRPPGIALRRRLLQKRQNALVRGLAVDRLLACPEPILQPAKAVLRKPPPPVADDARLNTHFRGDRTGAAALSRQQHYPRPPHIALRRARCPAARLKHLTYLRLEPNLSPNWLIVGTAVTSEYLHLSAVAQSANSSRAFIGTVEIIKYCDPHTLLRQRTRYGCQFGSKADSPLGDVQSPQNDMHANS